MKAWNLDVSVATVDETLSWCLAQGADRLLVAARMHKDGASHESRWVPSIEETAVRELLGRHLIESFTASGWPGTELIDHPGTVFVSSLDKHLISVLSQREPLISRWLHQSKPPLPEDLCALRSGATMPLLITVTHEGDGWLLSSGKGRPALEGIGRSEMKVDNLKEFLFDGPYYCRPWRATKGASGGARNRRRP